MDRSTWFRKYIDDLTRANGEDWVRLLQRAAGATLFGGGGGDETKGNTDAIMVLKGPTRCGKSTFIECLLACAGDYGTVLSENLLFGSSGNPEFAVATLYGRRILAAAEPKDTIERNAALNVSMLKKVTGGDTLRGRLPYARADLVFRSEAMLWISTNHSLLISDGEAVWRRQRIFEFAAALDFTGKADEPQLRKALRKDPFELRVALAWMLEGARLFAEEGWGSTSIWDEARAESKAVGDPFHRFITEHVTFTGEETDTFTWTDLAARFGLWQFKQDDVPTLPTARLKEELVDRIVRSSLTFDKHSGVFGLGDLEHPPT